MQPIVDRCPCSLKISDPSLTTSLRRTSISDEGTQHAKYMYVKRAYIQSYHLVNIVNTYNKIIYDSFNKIIVIDPPILEKESTLYFVAQQLLRWSTWNSKTAVTSRDFCFPAIQAANNRIIIQNVA